MTINAVKLIDNFTKGLKTTATKATLDQALEPVLLLFPPLLALLAAIFNLSVSSTPILPFGACYVIIHKVY